MDLSVIFARYKMFDVVQIGSVVELRLPQVDAKYRMIHNEEPMMLYPGERTIEYVDDRSGRYLISNYCRIYSYKKHNLVKSISSIYLPTWLKENFTADELDNEYTKHNLEAVSPVSYYKAHREQRIEYQRKYRTENIDKVRASEKKYRELNHDKLLERAKQRRNEHKANMTEEERNQLRAKAREYYRQKKQHQIEPDKQHQIEPEPDKQHQIEPDVDEPIPDDW